MPNREDDLRDGVDGRDVPSLAAQRADQILDAALSLFSERGFDGARMEEVARRAGLSKGAVYLYFPSKRALLEGIVQRAVSPVAREALDDLRAHRGNPLSALRVFLGKMGARVSEPEVAAVLKIVMREAIAMPEIAAMYREAVLDHALPALARMIAAGVERREIRPVDPELTVRSIVGPIIAHLILSQIFGVQPAGGLEMDRLVDNHLSILERGLAPETGPGS